MSLITEYSLWWTILCILAGILYSVVLYYNDLKFKELEKYKLRTMSVLRGIFVSIICFFLLSPLLRTFHKIIEKPIILIAQDNSESIMFRKDSSFIKEYKKQIENLTATLSTQYEVINYSFGDKPLKNSQYNFKDKITDFSSFFNEIESKFSNRNVGALILASDGIFNKGTNPLFSISNFNFPFYTIALGDTLVKKDIILSQIKSNKIAFLGNKFPVQALVEVKQLKGISTELKVSHKGKTIFSQNISAKSENYSETIYFEIKADEKGVQRYVLELSTNEQEISTKNNAKEIVIDIIDNRQKVLLLGSSPHPDLGAIKKAVEQNPNFEVEIEMAKTFNKPLNSYNLIIFHQLPSKNAVSVKVLSQWKNSEIPALFIVGTQTAPADFDALGVGISIMNNSNTLEESKTSLNSQFDIFEMSTDLQEFLRNVPALTTYFGNFKASASTKIMLTQKIKNIATKKPLVAFKSDEMNAKMGFILGEGIWKWRIDNFVKNGNHELFDEWINKILNYLVLKVKKENFVVNTKRIITENESVIFDAELYNESFESVNSQEIALEIFNSQGKKFTFTFDKTANAYFLNAGVFASGDYSFVARVTLSGKELTKEGKFSIAPINLEEENVVANHHLLYKLSKNTGGKFFTQHFADSIVSQIRKNEDIVPISYSEKNTEDLLNLRWLFFAIISIISLEWFLRKYFGSY